MLNTEQLAARRAVIATSPDLIRLQAQLAARAAVVLDKEPFIPSVKALLSVDGGVCPRDGSALEFDPWSPHAHRCPTCGESFSGERHHRWWARFQHLWLGERIAHLAALAAFAGDDRARTAASRLIVEYGARYLDYPNADNVLGPARLFFSTYLESIWVTNVIAAALMLRSTGQLDQETADAVDLIANEAANLIGDFNEGMSNRQTWHNAALTGLAVWFGDEPLLLTAVESPTGLLAHLMNGFGDDGMWFEGENYHLFALRGLLVGLHFARAGDLDSVADPALPPLIENALRAPTLTALPDLTFPARKDSRFGVSLAQPMYLENWETGFGFIGGEGDLARWLESLYQSPAPRAMTFDSYLHEAGLPSPGMRGREDLSWWTLAVALPGIERGATHASPASVLLDGQGLAVLRTGQRYASLECGILGGGHGHPDRLHLTLYQDGVHWLPDPGAGSYVSRDLFWYRSTLAHNAPRLDGASQRPGDATCEYFQATGEWSWVRGHFDGVTRSVISGPDHLLDIVELSGTESRLLELPWHLSGEWEILSPGRWEPATLPDEFVSEVTRFLPAQPGPIEVRARSGTATLSLTMVGADELLRALGPGVPGAPPAPFLVARATGPNIRVVTAITSELNAQLQLSGDQVTVAISAASTSHAPDLEGWRIESPAGNLKLRGRRAPVESPTELRLPGFEAHAIAIHLSEAGDDVSLTGAEPLWLDREDQYRRSEDPWLEDGSIQAQCWAAWTDDQLLLSIEVTKPDVWFRPRSAPPLLLDNEPDDINSDGVQVYMRPLTDGPAFGFLIVPEPDAALRVRVPAGMDGTAGMAGGHWERTDSGYRIDAAFTLPGWEQVGVGSIIGFDLLINEMRPGRQRRAGQLVWSGDGGWVWLRGDRHDPRSLGQLELGTA